MLAAGQPEGKERVREWLGGEVMVMVVMFRGGDGDVDGGERGGAEGGGLSLIHI